MLKTTIFRCYDGNEPVAGHETIAQIGEAAVLVNRGMREVSVTMDSNAGLFERLLVRLYILRRCGRVTWGQPAEITPTGRTVPGKF
jgi:hypothetical protein